MIDHSTLSYGFIRLCVSLLGFIAPASLVYCALVLLPCLFSNYTSAYRVHGLIEVWFAAESAFYLVFFIPYRIYLQRDAVHPHPGSRRDRQVLFERCKANIDDPKRYLSQWFFGADLQDIRRENIEEFLAWGFFNAARVSPEDEKELGEYVGELERVVGVTFPPGRSNVKSLRLTLSPVVFLHRTLLWYMCIFGVDTAMQCSMIYNGFQFRHASRSQFLHVFPPRPITLQPGHESPSTPLTYWYKEHTAQDALPVLFLHGIGVGLYPYSNFLRDLRLASSAKSKQGQIGIIAVEVMPVSSRITSPALDRDVMVREIHKIILHHGWTKYVLVSHSYGSAITTHLLKSPLTSPRIGPVVLVDPVTFLLHLPDVAYNFTAHKPTRANEWQLWYFGSMDPGVAHTLGRRFFWSQNIIWKEDLLIERNEEAVFRDVTVVMSGRDLIVDTKAVRRYLITPTTVSNTGLKGGARSEKQLGSTERAFSHQIISNSKSLSSHDGGLRLMLFENLDHAQIFDTPSALRELVAAVLVYSAVGTS